MLLYLAALWHLCVKSARLFLQQIFNLNIQHPSVQNLFEVIICGEAFHLT